ncbi:tetratricopeptide repeat protein [Chloroflexales bacterium ZM16-3]|nr:tetratricopeptide repeat protein [Chloroflexales bacterium ZM16-3]
MSDLPLSDELYQCLRDLLLDRLGLHFPASRRTDLARSLSLVAQDLGYSDLGRLYTALLVGGPVWDTAIRHLTIGETYFFRNSSQFAALRERILPDLLARRAATRSLRLWSAGCASGEEPYSLAMVLADMLPADTGWQVSILGTDLNLDFLGRAREGLYGPWSFRETPDAVRNRFFSAEGARWRLRPEIRRNVIFNRLNLASSEYPTVTNGTMAMDLIFCRNVLIYFNETTTRAIIDRLYEALAPGGWLVVGHAEPNATTFHRFETVNAPGTVLYRKPPDAPLFATATYAYAAGVPIAPPKPLRPATPAPLRSHSILREPATPPRPPAIRKEPPGTGSLSRQNLAAPAPDILAEARAAANAGRWERAAELADRTLAAEPMRAGAHFLRGQIYEHEGQSDQALDAYRRSLYIDPTLAMGALAMADIWRMGGQNADARRSYRSALRLLEQFAPADAVPESDGASAAELRAYIKTQIDLLDK